MIGSNKCSPRNGGFTIIELLIVVVIIGILAAVVLVSFSGIQQRAVDSALKSDISGAVKQLHILNITNGTYPSNGASIKRSPSTTLSYIYDAATNSYCLDVANGSSSYYQLSSQGTYQSGTCASAGFGAPTILANTLAGGNTYSCAMTNANALYCWGTGSSLGSSSVPVAINTSGALAGKTVASVSAGSSHACALTTDFLLYCWGTNAKGQLGDGTTTASTLPVAVSMSGALSGKKIIAVATGAESTCVIANDNLPYCWGANDYGQIGNGTTNATANMAPTQVTTGALAGKTVKEISTKTTHVCVIASDNLPYCWGYNGSGKLGNGLASNASSPVAVVTSGALSGKTVSRITTGNAHTCVIASDSKPYCWGDRSMGQLGDGSTTGSSNVPVAVTTSGVLSGKTLSYITAGYFHTCTVATNNVPYCWGYNANGQLGNGTTTQQASPVATSTSGVLAGKTIVELTASRLSTLVKADTGLVYAWGGNSNGDLGNGSYSDALTPIHINSPF